LIEAGFVQPARGPRNEFRFSFRDVVLLRTAFQLQSANISTQNISTQKIVRALAKMKKALPADLPLSGIRITAVGSTIAVKTGPSQWDANTGQLLLDFEVAPIRGEVAFLDSVPRSAKDSHVQADLWFTLAEQIAATDPAGAEQAYRKVFELSPRPHYHAYTNLGVLLYESGSRCEEALAVFEEALKHFPDAGLLHFNRAVVLEELGRIDDAAASYRHCLRLDPTHADAHYNMARLSELQGDMQALLRHLSAYRKLTD
jgi:tetratricopeptide (TPR) repeat protein